MRHYDQQLYAPGAHETEQPGAKIFIDDSRQKDTQNENFPANPTRSGISSPKRTRTQCSTEAKLI